MMSVSSDALRAPAPERDLGGGPGLGAPALSLFWIGCVLPGAPPTESDVGSQTSFLSFWTGCGEVEQRFHPSVLGPGPVDSPPQRQNKLAKRAGACSSNGERDSDPASPMTYATGNQPRP